MDSWADIVDDELSGTTDNSDAWDHTSDKMSDTELAEPTAYTYTDTRSWAQVVGGISTTVPSVSVPASVPVPALIPAPVPIPGDPVGIRAVQSILMSATQTNLSHFHTAGMDTANASVKPSAADAMDGVYTTRNTSMKFKSSANIKEIRRLIVGAKFGDFVKFFNTVISRPERENIWYEVLGVPIQEDVIRFYIDYRKMFMHGMTLNMLAENAFGNECEWKVSPDFMGMIDVETPDEHVSKWLSRIEQRVCGTLSITSCHNFGEYFITLGTDVLAVSLIETVDTSTIVSNNVTEIEIMFGIEAAAQVLCKLTGQRIVSDFMTRTGTVLPFNQRGEIQTSGLLTRMGFERPKDEIKKALIHGPTSNVGVYDCIMTGMDPWNNMECRQQL